MRGRVTASFLQLGLELSMTFLVMGAWVSVIAVATEKRGGRLGGFFVGFPSTAASSRLFTGLFASVPVVVEATDAFPAFLSIVGIFLLGFGYLSTGGFIAPQSRMNRSVVALTNTEAVSVP